MKDPLLYGTNEEKELLELWPDPGDAPHVPPKKLLRECLAEPESVNQELVRQIEECPTCQRALTDLKIDHSPIQVPSDLTVPSAMSRPPSPPVGITPSPGCLCSTSEEIPFFDGQTTTTRQNYSPETVLILERTNAIAGFDAWKVAPTVPLFTVPEDILNEDDLTFETAEGLEYVVWHDLVRPVLARQINKVIAENCISENDLSRSMKSRPNSESRELFLTEDDYCLLYWNQQKAKAGLLDAEILVEKEKQEEGRGNLIIFPLVSHVMAIAADTPEVETTRVVGQVEESAVQLIAQFLPGSDQNQVCFRVVDTGWKMSTELDSFQIQNPIQSKDFIPIQDGIAYVPFSFEILKEGFPFLLRDPEGNEVHVKWMQEDEN
jgi:hypothetical protein